MRNSFLDVILVEGTRHNVGAQGVIVLEQLGLVVFTHQQLYFCMHLLHVSSNF